MTFLTIRHGSDITYKTIEILKTDITYNNLKDRICRSKILYKYGRLRKSNNIKIQQEYELFHNNERPVYN